MQTQNTQPDRPTRRFQEAPRDPESLPSFFPRFMPGRFRSSYFARSTLALIRRITAHAIGAAPNHEGPRRRSLARRIPTMQDRQCSPLSRSHLLRMTRLAQRAVDYSIKAYELGSYEICHIVRNTEDELCKLQLNIGDRGRWLRAEGRPVEKKFSPS